MKREKERKETLPASLSPNVYNTCIHPVHTLYTARYTLRYPGGIPTYKRCMGGI